MKCVALLTLLAIFCSVLPSGQAVKCGTNEVYLQCGPGCPPTCAQPNPGTCPTLVCENGCFCKPKYLRNGKGKCVKPENCSAGVYQKVRELLKKLG